MQLTEIQRDHIQKETTVSAVRSSGPGGQNVNKVSTKIELRWNLLQTNVFSFDEMAVLTARLGEMLTREGDLIIYAQETRSQLKNKEAAFDKLFRLIEKVLTPRKKRKPTQPTLASKEKRMQTKKIASEKKTLRGKIRDNE
jgi:ribosome-associated protein